MQFRMMLRTLKSLFNLRGLGLLGMAVILQMSVALRAEYSMIWSDEFDYTGLPNPEFWSYDVGGWGWGNAESQYYTDARLENARVEDGRLIIEAREEQYEGLSYTSARILTQDKKEFQYGVIEARIKLPAGVGVWPAFWMLGANFGQVNWPNCGEIDIMEYVGRLPNEIHGTVHGPGYSGGFGVTALHDFGGPATEEFHVYKVVWEADLIRWYVNDILYHTVGPDDIGGSPRAGPNEWVFDQPFFIILNVALGGTFGGPISPEMTFPVQMEVDYVRAYANLGPLSGYAVSGDWIDTGDFMGMASIANLPWVYTESLGSFMYIPPNVEAGNWVYIPR